MQTAPHRLSRGTSTTAPSSNSSKALAGLTPDAGVARLWKGYTVRHFRHLSAAFLIPLLAALLLAPSADARDKRVPPVRLVPEKVGEFRAGMWATPAAAARNGSPVWSAPQDYGVREVAGRIYTGPNGERLLVQVVETHSPAAAYSLLQREAALERAPAVRTIGGLGLQGFEMESIIAFAKGGAVVHLLSASEEPLNREAALAFARPFAERIEGEANFIPVLVLHLPDWEKKLREGVGFAVTLPALQQTAGARPVFDALSFEGGAEAATAAYGEARLVVIEFSTPQHSVETDARINERIAQLAAAGQPIPSFYQRVGNYSVFVFDAANETAARALASGVKYEKDVRWLGRNPHEGEKVERYVTQTMGGAIITALLTTGVAILASLGVGGLIGGAIFAYRRSRPGAQETYSDAGGMMRLNLEDFDAAAGTTKMLGQKRD
jgi:hypothetical protein